jgi:hypothetical protein
VSTSATQQFDGSTIEEALGAAVASMGDDLEIVDAQRVRRRRRFGVRREERFEVIAAPRSSSDEFEDVLRRMVDRVDEREREHEVDLRGARADATVDLRTPRGGVDLADSDLSWWEGAEFVVPNLPTPSARTAPEELEIDVRTPPTALDEELFGSEPARRNSDAAPIVAEPARPEAPRARDVVPEVLSPAPVFDEAELDEPTYAKPPAHGRPVHDGPTFSEQVPRRAASAAAPGAAIAWSLDALADLGLAPLVIERVGARNPRADLEWVAALAAAIEDIAAAIDPHASNVELTGHGRHAAVDLIGGLCRGMRVGHLVIDGVRIEATPVELALGVRACLQA